MDKIVYSIAMEAHYKMSMLPADEFIKRAFPNYVPPRKDVWVQQFKNEGFDKFVDGLTMEQKKNVDTLFTDIYGELLHPFLVTVCAYHSEQDAMTHLNVLARANNSTITKPADLTDALARLSINGLNFMLIWQKKGSRAVLYLDSNNFKQR